MNQEDPVIPWEQHWISQAKAHRGTMDTPYHRNRLSMMAKLEVSGPLFPLYKKVSERFSPL